MSNKLIGSQYFVAQIFAEHIFSQVFANNEFRKNFLNVWKLMSSLNCQWIEFSTFGLETVISEPSILHADYEVSSDYLSGLM